MGLASEMVEDMYDLAEARTYEKVEEVLIECINNVEIPKGECPNCKDLLDFFDNICGLVGFINGEKKSNLQDVISKHKYQISSRG